ncbi:LysR family transcriptional regulator [Rhizobium sp. RCC_161_2]|uniref:LysR family transcriptional regulator n=1 Tax=Rhizobium sp. RCC_161_2 TaxID=3239219 RepID=UPI003524BF98
MNERPFGTNLLAEAIEIATNDVVPTAPQDCQPSGGSGRRMNRLPPLNLFRVFEAAAHHGSFTAAADELCITQSAVLTESNPAHPYLICGYVAQIELWIIVAMSNLRDR